MRVRNPGSHRLRGLPCPSPFYFPYSENSRVAGHTYRLIRCGTPNCEWGHKIQDPGEGQLRLCYSGRFGSRARYCPITIRATGSTSLLLTRFA